MEHWIHTSRTGIPATNKARWWNHIKDLFTNVFRNVISACSTVICEEKFMNQGPICFNNLEKCLMISVADKCVKLLPDWDAKKGRGINIDKLQQLMSSIIGLPFELNDVAADGDFKLPNELVSFLHNLSNDNLKYVGLKFLLDAPYFWCGNKRYRFIENLYDLMKRDMIQRKLLNDKLKCRHDEARWVKNIAQYAVLWGIYKYAGSSGVAPAKYELDIDVVRFSSNVYRHYNDEQYKKLRTKALERVKIEDELRAAIPNLYVNLSEALLLYAKSNRGKREAIFKKALSSEYL
ncbi:hypothetical protein QQP08_020719 [Theobroma cacao]|nr:hypothetical protein QQP08_020719 [Theobroma cacao]